MSLAKLEKHLLTYSDAVARELKVVEKSEAKFKDVYHISIDSGIKKFTPRISDFQMDGEDRTVPRVVGATSLLGCILAYAHIQKDYLQEPDKIGKEVVGKHFEWNNGYYIYQLDYELALKPSDELVPMATQTDETWLINYTSESSDYCPKKIGKFFVKEFIFRTKDDSKHDVETTVLLEITSDEGVQFSKNHRLGKGYWQLEIGDVGSEAWKSKSWEQDEDIVVKEIDRNEWLASKNAIASMLGHEEMDNMLKAPAYASW